MGKNGNGVWCREKGVTKGTPTVVGKGWTATGVAAPILTLSENRGPHGDKEGGATLPSLLCFSSRGHGACTPSSNSNFQLGKLYFAEKREISYYVGKYCSIFEAVYSSFDLKIISC